MRGLERGTVEGEGLIEGVYWPTVSLKTAWSNIQWANHTHTRSGSGIHTHTQIRTHTSYSYSDSTSAFTQRLYCVVDCFSLLLTFVASLDSIDFPGVELGQRGGAPASLYKALSKCFDKWFCLYFSFHRICQWPPPIAAWRQPRPSTSIGHVRGKERRGNK